jgi:hypothetical protein
LHDEHGPTHNSPASPCPMRESFRDLSERLLHTRHLSKRLSGQQCIRLKRRRVSKAAADECQPITQQDVRADRFQQTNSKPRAVIGTASGRLSRGRRQRRMSWRLFSTRHAVGESGESPRLILDQRQAGRAGTRSRLRWICQNSSRRLRADGTCNGES